LMMSPSPWLPPLALAWTSESLPRPSCAVLVEHHRPGLSLRSCLRAYPSRFAMGELRFRCDTKAHPLLPLARVRSMSRFLSYSSEFARAPSGLVELLTYPSASRRFRRTLVPVSGPNRSPLQPSGANGRLSSSGVFNLRHQTRWTFRQTWG
jgi:hypothetical protein